MIALFWQEAVRCHAHCHRVVFAAETENKVGEVQTKEIEENPSEHKGEELEVCHTSSSSLWHLYASDLCFLRTVEQAVLCGFQEVLAMTVSYCSSGYRTLAYHLCSTETRDLLSNSVPIHVKHHAWWYWDQLLESLSLEATGKSSVLDSAIEIVRILLCLW